jgi:hypothetical protein
LRLDSADPPPARAADAAAETASSAQAAREAAILAVEALVSAQAASAASAAEARIAVLEQSIAKLQSDSAVERQTIALLRERVLQTDSAARWLPWLLIVMAVLVLLALWQALKLRRLQADGLQAWARSVIHKEGGPETKQTAAPAAASVAPVVVRSPGARDTGTPSTTAMPLLSGDGGGTGSAAARGSVFTPDPFPLGPVETTAALASKNMRESAGEAPRDLVSIEELIDLEQQAEFFIVLGQEEAAIDLLVDYLRSTGGGSPMPYLKLLEIYRRKGDREAYDRTRARFNHRFNAYAPEWSAADHEGRSLEDYPAIITRLQETWDSPIDAMAELESLLFRKSRGEVFDMPAYRDVLFLYALARDLMDRVSAEAGSVDVLLPISEDIDHTKPMSLDETPGGRGTEMPPLDNLPTMPPDVDITQPSVPDSLFSDSTLPPSGGRRW